MPPNSFKRMEEQQRQRCEAETELKNHNNETTDLKMLKNLCQQVIW